MNKELTPLEALKEIKQIEIPGIDMGEFTYVKIGSCPNYWRLFSTIEKALKALEIIKGFVDFNVYEMQGKYYLTTGNNYRGQILISKEEYDLLKEVLL